MNIIYVTNVIYIYIFIYRCKIWFIQHYIVMSLYYNETCKTANNLSCHVVFYGIVPFTIIFHCLSPCIAIILPLNHIKSVFRISRNGWVLIIHSPGNNWNKALRTWSPLVNIIPVTSQWAWGQYQLPSRLITLPPIIPLIIHNHY